MRRRKENIFPVSSLGEGGRRKIVYNFQTLSSRVAIAKHIFHLHIKETKKKKKKIRWIIIRKHFFFFFFFTRREDKEAYYVQQSQFLRWRKENIFPFFSFGERRRRKFTYNFQTLSSRVCFFQWKEEEEFINLKRPTPSRE